MTNMMSLWRHLWSNYATLDFKILTQCVKSVRERVLQVSWLYLHWFRRYRKKTRGGLKKSPPQVGRGLISKQCLPKRANLLKHIISQHWTVLKATFLFSGTASSTIIVPAQFVGLNETSGHHPCQRECSQYEEPKTCYYHFVMEYYYTLSMVSSVFLCYELTVYVARKRCQL